MEKVLTKENRSFFMGFAILWIIGLHFYMYSAFPEGSIWGFLFSKGYIGVDIFLFLSAYGLCFSYNNNSLATFYKRRLLRIYPAYIPFLIITLIFYGKTYSEPAWQSFLFQSTGLASFRQTDFEWYVPALIVVYAAFPLLYKGLHWLYRHFKLGIAALAILLSLSSTLLSRFIFPMFAGRLSIIVLGVATFLALSNDDKPFLFKTYFACAIFTIVFNYGNNPDWSLLVPGLLLLLASCDVKFPLVREVSFMGKHSLEIYLAQSFALNQFFLKSDMQYWQKCLIALAIIIVGSVLLNYIQKGCKLLFTDK